MKLLLIPARSNAKISFSELRLSGKIGVVTTIQYLEKAKKLCNKNLIFGGQILGCNFNSALKIRNKVDKYLYVGTGEFHPIGLALATGKEVHVFNPMSNKSYALDKNQVIAYEKKRKVGILKFLNAKKVGLLVSLKEGQYSPGIYKGIKEKIKNAEVIKKKYPEKQFYLFTFNTLRKEELENFNDIECWVNFACPRIVDDNNQIVNAKDVIK